jgi:hypothetical protein
MLPFFDPEQKRKINLGGATRVSSASAILDSVKAQREERQELKRRQDAAVRVQAWWRGRSQSKWAKKEMKSAFKDDILGIRGLRCLVLMGLDEEALGLWSQAVLNGGMLYFIYRIELRPNNGFCRRRILSCTWTLRYELADFDTEGGAIVVAFCIALDTVCAES